MFLLIYLTTFFISYKQGQNDEYTPKYLLKNNLYVFEKVVQQVLQYIFSSG